MHALDSPGHHRESDLRPGYMTIQTKPGCPPPVPGSAVPSLALMVPCGAFDLTCSVCMLKGPLKVSRCFGLKSATGSVTSFRGLRLTDQLME